MLPLVIVINLLRKIELKELVFTIYQKMKIKKKRWLQNIKRENLPKNPSICHLHFEEGCFNRELEVIQISSS